MTHTSVWRQDILENSSISTVRDKIVPPEIQKTKKFSSPNSEFEYILSLPSIDFLKLTLDENIENLSIEKINEYSDLIEKNLANSIVSNSNAQKSSVTFIHQVSAESERRTFVASQKEEPNSQKTGSTSIQTELQDEESRRELSRVYNAARSARKKEKEKRQIETLKNMEDENQYLKETIERKECIYEKMSMYEKMLRDEKK